VKGGPTDFFPSGCYIAQVPKVSSLYIELVTDTIKFAVQTSQFCVVLYYNNPHNRDPLKTYAKPLHAQTLTYKQ
jgi:hypothetical protein